MIVGYARTSTTEHVAGFEAQLRMLEVVGCEKTFKEQVSAVKQRDQLDAAMEFIREGDTFAATRLDRLPKVRKSSQLCRHSVALPNGQFGATRSISWVTAMGLYAHLCIKTHCGC
jgi:DNA invertase Pin-like site-specific DNA recombinase